MANSVTATTYPSARNDATESKLESWLAAVMRDGVIANAGNELSLFADSTGMQVKLPSGGVLLGGIRGDLAAQTSLDIAAANSTNPRIDTVVAELKRTPSPYTITFKVITGTAAGSPVAPTLTNDATFITKALKDVRVEAGVTTIAANKVTDRRVYAQPDNDLIEAGDGTNLKLGPGAVSGSGVWIRVTDGGVPNAVLAIAEGSGAGDVAHYVRSKGGGTHVFDTSGSGLIRALLDDAPGSGDTGLWLVANRGGVVTLTRVTMGGSDSAGSGFKVLRVPN